MNRSYFNWIILLAVICVLIVAIFMWSEQRKDLLAKHAPSHLSPMSPFKSYISAVGIVEPSSENIHIGSPVNRVVDQVQVAVGDKVKAGEVLFRLESSDLKADLEARCISYENAKANLLKLESLPRPEDVSASEAALKSVQVELEQAKGQYDRVAGLQNSGAMSLEEVNRRYFIYQQFLAKVQQVEAELAKTKAGAWLPDIEIAKLQVSYANAYAQQIEQEIKRTIIESPIDATVLQIKIQKGEYPPSDSSRTPPMIIGNTDIMHLRVNVNQFDASSFSPEAHAVAYL
ncbi:MAG: biotin/lipoyl-binding protein, partial [Parachlamydiaceae bacterium]|nr:biotin/lipoyl-binding protein [Parachlamydiaceae bacterium]